MDNSSNEQKPPVKHKTWFERITALINREPQNKEDLMEVLQDVEGRNILSTEMLSMTERLLQMSEMQVREVMVPRAQMTTIRKDMSLPDIMTAVIESGHSRFPVYDEEKDDIIGVLLAKDLLRCASQSENPSIKLRDLMRPAIFTPQSKRLDVLLREFRINRGHLAIALDEYGHIAGLITIEDILEQVVGDIIDESDVDEDDIHIKKLDEDIYIVKGNTTLTEFNQIFNTKLSLEDKNTVNEVLLHLFGHLPRRGEMIEWQSLSFKILHSDNRKIYLIEVKVRKE